MKRPIAYVFLTSQEWLNTQKVTLMNGTRTKTHTQNVFSLLSQTFSHRRKCVSTATRECVVDVEHRLKFIYCRMKKKALNWYRPLFSLLAFTHKHCCIFWHTKCQYNTILYYVSCAFVVCTFFFYWMYAVNLCCV